MTTKYYSAFSTLRSNYHIRDLVSESTLHPSQFVQVLFVDESLTQTKPVPNISGMQIDTKDSIINTIKKDKLSGISSFILFTTNSSKSSENESKRNKYIRFAESIISKIKDHYHDEIFLIVDVCICGYTQDKHCGFIDTKTKLIDNHNTVEELAKNAIALAKAGADCIAPSDMQDGRVLAIRNALNENQMSHISIMSYSAKFSSNYYGAFREIYSSTIPNTSTLKDRASYQLDKRNSNDALKCSQRDIDEGAQIIMVKPATRYLDILSKLKSRVLVPISAFQTASECASLELLASNNYGNIKDLYLEDWYSIKRAGANFIISYKSRFIKSWL